MIIPSKKLIGLIALSLATSYSQAATALTYSSGDVPDGSSTGNSFQTTFDIANGGNEISGGYQGTDAFRAGGDAFTTPGQVRIDVTSTGGNVDFSYDPDRRFPFQATSVEPGVTSVTTVVTFIGVTATGRVSFANQTNNNADPFAGDTRTGLDPTVFRGLVAARYIGSNTDNITLTVPGQTIITDDFRNGTILNAPTTNPTTIAGSTAVFENLPDNTSINYHNGGDLGDTVSTLTLIYTPNTDGSGTEFDEGTIFGFSLDGMGPAAVIPEPSSTLLSLVGLCIGFTFRRRS